MITCIIGTRAQLIKMAPLILEIERRQWPINLVMTGQHKETMDLLRHEFGIRSSPKHLYAGAEISGILDMVLWFVQALRKALSERAEYLPDSRGSDHAVLVHGDTASTLLGAVVGRVVGATVFHVEAGLRSRRLLHPFPEEIIRHWVTRLAHVGFCPGKWAYENLAGTRVRRIDTGQNTLVDSVRLAIGARAEMESDGGDFALASIHRFENIFVRRRMLEILELIELAATRYPIAFVLHPATRSRLERYGLLGRLQSNSRIKLVARMGFFEFIGTAKKSRFVITDGGGNQEEMSYLGVPTVLMRKATERRDGLGSTAVLCPHDRTAFAQFLDQLPSGAGSLDGECASPSSVIAGHLGKYA